ncbi:MAG: hypothetical protein M1839_007602 [Geoglossum umbratile]|nr:MAG: hypothetical protein M1839_007602 [Geoglossum umbratile]
MTLAYSTIPPLQFPTGLTSANLAYHLTHSQNPMDRGAPEYSQSGLHSPSYPTFTDPQSEGSSADQVSAAQYQPPQEARSSNFSTSATPTSEYGLNPPSARSSSFPEYLARPQYQEGATRYHASSTHSGSSGGMAQASSPSLPLADGRQNNHHNSARIKSDPEVPIDPSIAASSPGYPPQGQYPPYAPQSHDMAQTFPGHPPQNWRSDWSHYATAPAPPHGLPGPYSAHPSPSTNVSSASSTATAGARPGQVGLKDQRRKRLSHDQQQSHPLSQVYSFVPIPGAQQHKRPRRRYEEIERMYKCGWSGCEKAYGTLNHLNAHVTMQAHGQKRTPEEFKEIRKEWKARKKDEETQRKEEERQRQPSQPTGQSETQNSTESAQAPSTSTYAPSVRPQLPPIGYQPAPAGQVPPGHYQAPPGGIEQIQQYGNNQLYQNYPQSPYGQGHQMYQQRQTPLQGNEETDADAEPDPDVPAGNYQH